MIYNQMTSVLVKTRGAGIFPALLIKLNVACALLLTFALNLVAEDTRSQDGKGAYATGKYRNLFAEAGHSPTEIRQKIDSAFQQLFHGNLTNETVY